VSDGAGVSMPGCRAGAAEVMPGRGAGVCRGERGDAGDEAGRRRGAHAGELSISYGMPSGLSCSFTMRITSSRRPTVAQLTQVWHSGEVNT